MMLNPGILRKIWKLLFLFLLLLNCNSEVKAEFDEFSASEYGLKGAFIDKIINYVEWPQDTKYSAKDSFEILILGKNQFGDILDRIFQDKQAFNKNIVVKYAEKLNHSEHPDLIFISASMANQLNNILDAYKDKSVFFVGDTDGFCQKGVYLNFYREDAYLRFELNEQALKEAGFSVSFHLIRIAKIVNSGGE